MWRGWAWGTPRRRVAALAVLLLDHGARIDERDDVLRSTPLGWACRWGKAAMVELLLDRGADPVETGAEPWATRWRGRRRWGTPAIARMLRERMP